MNLLVIDDHDLVREALLGLAQREGFQIVGAATSKAEAIAKIAALDPDVITVDLSLPDGNGLEIVRWARKQKQSLGIVVISILDDDANLLASMNAGASAFVSKTSPIADIANAIQSAYKSPLSFTSKDLIRAVDSHKSKLSLTTRELEILSLLPSGKSGDEIAKDLFITTATLKTHLNSIYRKLSVHNRSGAVSEARRRGLIART